MLHALAWVRLVRAPLARFASHSHISFAHLIRTSFAPHSRLICVSFAPHSRLIPISFPSHSHLTTVAAPFRRFPSRVPSACSPRVSGTLDEKILDWERFRRKALETMDPSLALKLMKMFLPDVTSNYTIVTLLPSQAASLCAAGSSAMHDSMLRCLAPSELS